MKRRNCMRNSLLLVFLAISLFLCACDAVKFRFSVFEYADHAECAIEDAAVRKPAAAVTIPSEYGSYRVTEIADYAFAGEDRISELRMESVIEIRYAAFCNCRNLVKADLGGVKVIEECAFEGCTSLSELCMNEVQIIGEQAFRRCLSLESVAIPETVFRIKRGAFSGIANLQAVYFEGAPEHLEDDIFEGDKRVVIYGPVGTSVEEYAKRYGLEFVAWVPDGE